MQNSGTPQAAARRFFIRALRACTIPAEVTTDRAPAYLRVLDELIPSALHTVERYANNPGRDRSRTAESSPPAKARPEAPPFRTDPGRRACLRPEPPPRPLRTRHRRPRPPPDPRSIRRAHDGHLTTRSFSSARSVMRTDRPMQHCPRGRIVQFAVQTRETGDESPLLAKLAGLWETRIASALSVDRVSVRLAQP
jgi:hypothetical protein